MNELLNTIAPKSDQLNAEDLLAGPRRITITEVAGCADTKQPVSIRFAGDNGKPYKPNLTMRKLLVLVYGKDASIVGKSLMLFRDPDVIYAGEKVGGIVISHASHIATTQRHMLTVTRGKKKVFTVEPLPMFDAELAALKAAASLDELKAAWLKLSKEAQSALKPELDGIKAALAPAT